MTPDQYCAQCVAARGPHIQVALRHLPVAPLHAANAVYAFAYELEKILDDCHDAGVAQTKFEWWREELLRLFERAPRHPVSRALAPACATHGFQREPLLELLEATRATFGRVRVPDVETLRTHCRQMAVPQSLAARVFGVTDPATLQHAQALGAALRFAALLCDLGHDVRRDRLHLPAQDLQQFDVSESDLLASHHTFKFESLMTFEFERARNWFDEAFQMLPAADRERQQPGLIMANLARARLDEVRRDRYRVLEQRIVLPPLRQHWIAWTTRWREYHRRHAA